MFLTLELVTFTEVARVALRPRLMFVRKRMEEVRVAP